MSDIFVSNLHEIHKYRELDIDKVKQLYLNDIDFKSHFTINNSYQINVKNTLAIFDLSDHPLEGIYHSFILDLKHKFVLSTQSTNQIINTIYRSITVGGQVFQKLVSSGLGHKYLTVISLGHSAYFAHKGFSNGNANWVALHLLKDYQHCKKNKVLTFNTVDLDGIVFNIIWRDVKSCIVKRLKESLHHNKVVFTLITDHLVKRLALNILPEKHTRKSLIYNKKLFHSDCDCGPWSMTELVENLCSDYIVATEEYLVELTGFTWFESDEKNLIHRIKRNRYNN